MQEAASLVVHSEHAIDGRFDLTFEVHSVCVFQPVIRIQLHGPDGEYDGRDTHQLGHVWPWLPKGVYKSTLTLPKRLFPTVRVDFAWGTVDHLRGPDAVHSFGQPVPASSGESDTREWQLELAPASVAAISALPWQEGLDNWFFRHFDHAASVIAKEFLRDAPQLRGRILDVGAGDGITDLGIYLRYAPQELVAIDIVDYIRHLPAVASRHGIPLDELPSDFVFVNGSAEAIPYANEYFDLVLSWGSVEHVKGGYQKVLDEVWRVLRPGGLFFVNPGLYFAAHGSHLGEFFDEPHHHLKMSEEAMREHVLTHPPDRMDRSGFDVDGSEYWRFYKELNVIRVAEFERDLKRYGYRLIRGALRVSPMVEYDDKLQSHSLVDLSCEDAFFVLQKP